MRFTLNTVVIAFASASILVPSVLAVRPNRDSRSGLVAKSHLERSTVVKPVPASSVKEGTTRGSKSSSRLVARDDSTESDNFDNSGDLAGIAQTEQDLADALSGTGSAADSMSRILGELVGAIKEIGDNSQGDSVTFTPADTNLLSKFLGELNHFANELQGNATSVQTEVTTLQGQLGQENIVLTPDGSDNDDN